MPNQTQSTSKSNSRNQLVYDLPLRVFHWIFATLFLTAFAIAKIVDDDSVVFSFHMLAGIIILLLVGMRLLWGITGSKHSRFSQFALNPMDLIAYLKGVLKGDEKIWAGHNPASSWAALAMMVLSVGLGVSGYAMASGFAKEAAEEVHELFANLFVIIVILHVSGVLLHSFRHKDAIALSMVDGKKTQVALSEQIESARPVAGILFLSVVFVFAVALWKGFDSKTRALVFAGQTLQLGESEEGESKSGRKSRDRKESQDEGKENNEKSEHEEKRDDD